MPGSLMYPKVLENRGFMMTTYRQDGFHGLEGVFASQEGIYKVAFLKHDLTLFYLRLGRYCLCDYWRWYVMISRNAIVCSNLPFVS
jgi:hypothetical protein